MRNIIEKYFPEMGIDISWYSKKKITPNIPEKDNLDNLDILVKKCKKCNLYKTRNNPV